MPCPSQLFAEDLTGSNTAEPHQPKSHRPKLDTHDDGLSCTSRGTHSRTPPRPRHRLSSPTPSTRWDSVLSMLRTMTGAPLPSIFANASSVASEK